MIVKVGERCFSDELQELITIWQRLGESDERIADWLSVECVILRNPEVVKSRMYESCDVKRD